MANKGMRVALCALLLALLLPACTALADYSMPVRDGDLSVYEGLDENVKNILLIGTDTRENETASGRADTMMICSINQTTGLINVISLARDTWVTMGDNGHENKLNAAHTFGGPNLLMQTINRTYNLNIEHYVTVNFYGICDIVDTLGGVTIQLEKDEPWAINTTVEESYGNYGDAPIQRVPSDATEARLCGAQALAYARCRKLDNDLGRGERQNRLMAAMVRQTKHLSIARIIDIFKTLNGAWRSSLSGGEQVRLLASALWLRGAETAAVGMPFEGHWHYGEVNGNNGVVINLPENTRLLHEVLGLPAPATE